MKKPSDVFIFTDGASRGNPGAAGAGVYVKQNDQEIIKSGFYLDEKTNNQAEYLALALAVFIAKQKTCEKETCPKFVIASDSELLIRQMSGIYKVRNPILKNIKNAIDILLADVTCEFRHVFREKNKEADRLANWGVDHKKNMPESFISFMSKYNVIL
jgi:ribonuclease HI